MMNKVRTFFQNSTRALRSTSEDFTSILKCVSCHLKRRLKNIHNVQIKKNYMNGLLIIGRNNGMLVLSLSETKKKIKVQILSFISSLNKKNFQPLNHPISFFTPNPHRCNSTICLETNPFIYQP